LCSQKSKKRAKNGKEKEPGVKKEPKAIVVDPAPATTAKDLVPSFFDIIYMHDNLGPRYRLVGVRSADRGVLLFGGIFIFLTAAFSLSSLNWGNIC